MSQKTNEWAGKTLGGCRIERTLGQGGMGVVLYGVQTFLERPVAVKVLAPRFSRDRSFIERFEAEGRVLARLAHPNIARIHNMTVDGEHYVLVMEFVEGTSLGQRIARDGPLPPVEVAQIFLQVAQALDAAWVKGIVHRDVKPANLMLTPGGIVKLVDFGLADIMSAGEDSSASNIIAGSIRYMSPEQAAGQALDTRSDLYSLGICMWEALFGAPPFDGKSLAAIAIKHRIDPLPEPPSAAPRALMDLIAAMTQKEPVDRPAAPYEIIEALEAYLKTENGGPWALIVQPDQRQREQTEALCRARDLVPVAVRSGDDALAVLANRATPPRLTVTELVLPGSDGFAVLKALRRVAGPNESRAIVLANFAELRGAAQREADRLGIRCLTGLATSGSWVEGAIDTVLDLKVVTAPAFAVVGSKRESRRRERIAAMELVDEAPQDAQLKDIVERTAAALNMPVALISLVLEDRQWFKAHTGLGGHLLENRGSPIEDAFCRHVVNAGAPLYVNDAANHPFFGENRLVIEGAVGSYAGAPVVTAGGDVLGTLCVIDGAARNITADEMDSLVVLARRVAGELQLRSPATVGWSDAAAQLGLTPVRRLSEIDVAALGSPSTACLIFDDAHRVCVANAAAHAMLRVHDGALLGRGRDECLARLEQLNPWGSIAKPMRIPNDGPYAANSAVDIGVTTHHLTWSAWPVQLEEGRFQFEVLRKMPSLDDTRLGVPVQHVG